MSLAERVAAAQSRSQPGPKCGIAKTLPTLAQPDADALLHLIYKRLDMTGPEVSELLAEEDIDLSPDTVRRHRLGRCRTCNRR